MVRMISARKDRIKKTAIKADRQTIISPIDAIEVTIILLGR